MENNKQAAMNGFYALSILLLTAVFPGICCAIEIISGKSTDSSWPIFAKWFIFSAVGLRLFLAGIKQVANPAFTAKEIFHIDSPSSFPIVRELGFANICFGLIGIISLFLPQWRIVSAFASGLYYGIAGLQHLIKKPAGPNELLALISDVLIFLVLLIYVISII
jgi:hypothetical protein